MVNSVTHIGKESNNLEKAEVLGMQKDDYVIYGGDIERLTANKDKLLVSEPQDVKPFKISQVHCTMSNKP